MNEDKIMLDLEKETGKQLVKNIRVLQESAGYKDKVIAEAIGFSPSGYSKFINSEKVPGVFPALQGLRTFFKCSIDELLFTDLEQVKSVDKEATDEIKEEQYEKFYGVFQGFYYDNSASKGREFTDDAAALKSCILLIYKKYVKDKTKHKVLAAFGMDKKEAETLYDNVSKHKKSGLENAANYMLSRNRTLHLYHGEFELSTKHAFIDLKLGNREKVSMIFYNYADHFIGGLGTLNSISRGRKQEPVMQYIGLTRSPLNVAEEIIAEHLLTSYPKIKILDSIDDLMELINDSYGNGPMNALNERDKKDLIRGRIEDILNTTITHNLSRKVTLSEQDDEEFCNFILRSLNKNQ